MPQKPLQNVQSVQVETVSDLRDWLYANHAQSQSIWLVTFKKAVPEKYIPYDDIVDEAICFGWIDSLSRKLDETRTMLLLSPRRKGSAWSAVNKSRVDRLLAEERMHPAGLAIIEAAKKDGSWDFLNDVNALIEPPDLASLLDANPDARKNFSGFSPSSRRGILEWIKQAKRPETREKRIRQTVDLAKQGIKANH